MICIPVEFLIRAPKQIKTRRIMYDEKVNLYHSYEEKCLVALKLG